MTTTNGRCQQVCVRVPIGLRWRNLAAAAGSAFAIPLLLLTQTGTAIAHTSTITEPLVLASKAGPKRAPAPVRAADKPPARADAPIVTVAATGPGQAGYVHYFVITGPDGEPESHVGIELPGERIAWSFPELGVTVSPFIASGVMTANGKSYEIVHLYGIRPFLDDESMRALQRDLPARVDSWLANKTPFCDEARPSSGLCVSCLGFVLRVLYPGSSPALPALPADFKSVNKGFYTTEDLLLYLAGVAPDAARQLRLKRIEALAVPEELREELMRLSSAIDATAAPVAAAKGAISKDVGAKQRPATSSIVQLPKRVIPRRRS